MEENTYIQSIFNYIGIAVDKKNSIEIIVNFPIIQVKKDKKYLIKDYQISTQPFGTLFADFVNCDFNNKDEFISFFNKYSLSLLDINKFKKLFKNGYCIEEKYNNFIDNIYIKNLKKLIKIQEQLDMILDYTLKNPPKKSLNCTPIERLYVLERTNETLTIFRNNQIEYLPLHYFSKFPGTSEKEIYDNISKKNTSINSIDFLIPHTIESLIYNELIDILIEEITFKTCKCCNRYFIAENKKFDYCNNIAPNSTKTCREIGRKKNYYDNIKNDAALNYYNKIYYRKATMCSRYPDIKKYSEGYEHFKKIGKRKLSQYKSGKLTSDDFMIWIKKNSTST